MRGGAGPLGGGGGGLATARWPYAPGGGGADGPCWLPGNGEVIGAMFGVDRRGGGALVTRGTSFQFSLLLALGGGGAVGVKPLGGPEGGGAMG